jgi:hypothetical protein
LGRYEVGGVVSEGCVRVCGGALTGVLREGNIVVGWSLGVVDGMGCGVDFGSVAVV